MIREQAVIEHLVVEVRDSTGGDWWPVTGGCTSVDIDRGGERGGAVDVIKVGTASIVVRGEYDLSYEPAFQPAAAVRVRLKDGAAIFTGTIADVAQAHSFDKFTGNAVTLTTIVAVDAVQALANTPRFGAVTDGGVGFEPWANRLRRLGASATVPLAIPETSEREIYALTIDRQQADGSTTAFDGWRFAVTGDADYYLFENFERHTATEFRVGVARSGGNTLVCPPGSIRIERAFPDSTVTAGSSYRFDAKFNVIGARSTSGIEAWRLAANGKTGNARTFDPTGPVTALPMPSVEFAAPATGGTVLAFENAAEVRIGGHAGEFRVTVADARLVETAPAREFLLRDTVMETSLLNHFAMACNSVGARFWVDAAGVTQFRRGPEETAIQEVFTDKRGGSALEYTDITTAFDTRSTVNTLTVTNHGRKPDPDEPGRYVADDTATNPRQDPSITRWGARAGAIDVTLWTGGTHGGRVATRAGDIFTDRAEPRFGVTSVRWNAQEAPARAGGLDIYDRLLVNFGRLEQRCRVIRLRHKITPTRWMVDIDLTDQQVGEQFAAFDARYAGFTFEQFDALWAGKTFRDFDMDPLKEFG